jgi:hypothetical protein
MDSKILGKVCFDEQRLQSDIQKINGFEFSNNYSNYCTGEWKICILWNHTGSHQDFHLQDYEGRVKPTEFGLQLDYLNEFIADVFNTEYIRYVRIFLLRKGVIIPHTDYSKLKKDLFRVHIQLQTSLDCLGSNEDVVFHMRKGEVWFLDAAKPHSGSNLSDLSRLTLCIDFASDIEPSQIFKDKTKYDPSILPCIIERPPIELEYIQAIKSLGVLLCPENFEDILGLLAKVHFVRHTHADSMFDWMIDIAKQSQNKSLIDRAFLTKRSYLKTAPENQ